MQRDRSLAPSAFPGDTGEATPQTRRLLAEFTARPSSESYLGAVAALCGDRVLVPVVATATKLSTTEPLTTEPLTTEPLTTEPLTTEPSTTEPSTTEPSTTEPSTTGLGRASEGLSADKEAEMSVVGVQSPDGRRALLAFTGTDSLEAWDTNARPVPVTLDKAAEATLADGAAALLIDFAGPDPLVVEGEMLSQLAAGHRLVRLGEGSDGGFGWAVPTGP